MNLRPSEPPMASPLTITIGKTSLPHRRPSSHVALRPKIDVNLSTVERIEAILRAAEGPISRYRIHKELANLSASTTAARLNRALDYLYRRHDIVEGSKGVQWTRNDSEALRRAVLNGRRL